MDSGRYILFLIDSKFKDHDGKIFSSYREARDYAFECLDEKMADKFVIGFFKMDMNISEMIITCVETMGFPKDKKRIEQLRLFKE